MSLSAIAGGGGVELPGNLPTHREHFPSSVNWDRERAAGDRDLHAHGTSDGLCKILPLLYLLREAATL